MRRSNVTKMLWKSVLSEWIRMVITRFVFEWFAGINCFILRSQIPVKTKFATIKWYNLCLQIIQSQMCYPLNYTPTWDDPHQSKHKLCKGHNMLPVNFFFKIISAVTGKIWMLVCRHQDRHLCWQISPKNTNFAEDIEYLLPIMFL